MEYKYEPNYEREWYKTNMQIGPKDIILIGIMYTNEVWYIDKGKRYLNFYNWINNNYKSCYVNTKKKGKYSGEVIAMKELCYKCKFFNCNQFTFVVIRAPKSIYPNSVYRKSKKYIKKNKNIALKVDYSGIWPKYILHNCRIDENPLERASWVIIVKKDNVWENIYPYNQIPREFKTIIQELYEWVEH